MKNSNQGQSLIEFILSITFAIGILFLFVKIAFNVTEGYIVHYGTFMASRSYLVVDINSNEPGGADSRSEREAEKVLRRFIKNKKGIFKSIGPTEVTTLPFVGVSYKFKTRFSFGFLGGNTNLNLISESFLGKEPTRATCAFRICDSMERAGGNCELGVHMTLYDNGC